jgi:hypothetical protein
MNIEKRLCDIPYHEKGIAFVYGLLFTKICTNPGEATETEGATHVTELLVISDASTRVVLNAHETFGDGIVSSIKDPLRTMKFPP